MAQTFLTTATQGGNFEDLVDFITEVAYKKTPLLAKSGRSKAKAIKHDWVTQGLKAGATNARAEGYAPTFATQTTTGGDITPRIKQTNQCQILALPFSVSGTQDAVNKAGVGMSPDYDTEKDLKYKELALDLDFVLFNNTAVTRDADAGTPGQMDGILAWATGSNAVNAGGALLTEDLYNQLAQVISEGSSEDADTVFCAGFQKRAITGWTTPIRRLSDEKKFTNAIGEYDGDWGTQMIVHDKQIPVAQVLLCTIGFVKVAYLRPVLHEQLGRLGDKTLGYVLTECTLEVQAPPTVAKFTNLAVSA